MPRKYEKKTKATTSTDPFATMMRPLVNNLVREAVAELMHTWLTKNGFAAATDETDSVAEEPEAVAPVKAEQKKVNGTNGAKKNGNELPAPPIE